MEHYSSLSSNRERGNSLCFLSVDIEHFARKLVIKDPYPTALLSSLVYLIVFLNLMRLPHFTRTETIELFGPRTHISSRHSRDSFHVYFEPVYGRAREDRKKTVDVSVERGIVFLELTYALYFSNATECTYGTIHHVADVLARVNPVEQKLSGVA